MRLYSLLSIVVMAPVFIAPLSTHAEDFTMLPDATHKHRNKPLALSDLLEPINLTSHGLEYFFRKVYSHPGYAVDVLPNSFHHMHQLLLYNAPAHQKIAYHQSIVRLFSNRLKSCSFINPSALARLLETLPKILVSEDKEVNITSKKQEEIVDLLYQEFLSNFGTFKANPDKFFDTLSKKITTTVLQAPQDNTQKLFEFRTTFLTFLEISLGKLVWSPQDQEKTWENVKTVAQHLTALAGAKCIANEDQLCDLFITLTERYRFFVELMHESLSVEFFEKTRNDILHHPLSLLDLAEQESFVESRKDRLLRTLELCEARARAREYPSKTPQALFSEEREKYAKNRLYNLPQTVATEEENAPKKIRKRRRRD